MRSFQTAVAAAIATAALTFQGVGAKCVSQPVVDSCLQTTMAAFKTCAYGDFECQCNLFAPVVACYDACADDHINQEKRSSESATLQNYCGHAAAHHSVSAAMAAASESGASDEDAVDASSGSASRPSATGSGMVKKPKATSSASEDDDDESTKDDSGVDSAARPAILGMVVMGALAFAAHAY
ncbi:hypothetical protein H4R35_000628 [Dimargaris xerosporica]|nr:hypothetical protein H4R35_000628 [Dimargaris xerosporica]